MLKWPSEQFTPWAVAWTTIISNITLIAALVIAYWTYVQSAENSQKDKSLEYVADFNRDDMLEARNVVYRVWKDFDFKKKAPGGSREVIYAIVERVTADHDQHGPEKSIKTAIINISTFFDSASVCARTEVCDGGILQTQLGPYARSFYCLYAEWIAAEQAQYNLPALGSGMIELAENEGSC
ncbi:hypothetical protein ABGN05_09370 [Aquibium sp. LZ166]|uniref:DUF4760 domain-containing protein n=1 Tax=Aquibium pacificus TaxID=3153579 RepID=A0ABV3SGI0_9HYPH